MKKEIRLDELLSFFPEVELPIEITEDLVMTAESVNKVFPKVIVEEYIAIWEGGEDFDEFTEFVPILQIKEAEEFHALVYWKGGLMKYEYILVTLDKLGEFITRKPIASTLSDGKTVKKSVAKIDEDMIIHIMAGENEVNGKYDPSRSQAFNMEILFSGDVIFSLGDD
ncbi:MAG: hypothetical protein P1U56_06590 [Saprospiraceae bacterium]|nr:hypothetical protein [Saprospiraceae bacterium]